MSGSPPSNPDDAAAAQAGVAAPLCIPALVQLLQRGNAPGKTRAARALGILASNNAGNKMSIVVAGALAELQFRPSEQTCR